LGGWLPKQRKLARGSKLYPPVGGEEFEHIAENAGLSEVGRREVTFAADSIEAEMPNYASQG
jgi:hypothetical protein